MFEDDTRIIQAKELPQGTAPIQCSHVGQGEAPTCEAGWITVHNIYNFRMGFPSKRSFPGRSQIPPFVTPS